MKFNIVWNDDGYMMHRGGIDPRPTEVEADSHEIVYSNSDASYPMGLRFLRGEDVVATLFQLPLAVIPVVEPEVDDSDVPF